MIKVLPYKAQHLDDLLKYDEVAYLRPFFSLDVRLAMEKNPYIRTVEISGEVVFVGGVTQYWPGRGEAWGFFSPSCKSHALSMVKLIKGFLKECPIRRIEASVEVGSLSAHRLVHVLGFNMEAPFMKAFRPDGGDCSLYSRVI
jgi:hypothetical protein